MRGTTERAEPLPFACVPWRCRHPLAAVMREQRLPGCREAQDCACLAAALTSAPMPSWFAEMPPSRGAGHATAAARPARGGRPTARLAGTYGGRPARLVPYL
eukprot:3227597-Pyramimonas_sp.AAC.1